MNKTLHWFLFISFFLLGERPYNDDSLLSDSMRIEHEQLLDEIFNVSTPDLNLTQISKQVDDLIPSTADADQTSIPTHVNASNPASPSDSALVVKANTTVNLGSAIKKSVPRRKKRSSEIK